MMSVHLVHYLRSLVARFNASVFKNKCEPNAQDLFSDDESALHTWNTVKEIL